MHISDEQWRTVRALFPPRELRQTTTRGGRPYRHVRDILDGVMWVLRTGAPWSDLPRRYPPYQTCHRRYQVWVRSGVLTRLLRALAKDLLMRGQLDLTEAFIDGSHAGAKKRGALVGKTRRGKATFVVS